MKKRIVLLSVLLVFLMSSILFAFTAQTKGTVTRVYSKGGVKNYAVMIDHEIVLIQDSIQGVRAGDNVLINILIDGPNQSELSIIFNIKDMNAPPGAERR